MLEKENIKSDIENGNTYLGLKLGNTRIKAILIDGDHQRIASGSHKNGLGVERAAVKSLKAK